jgi:hypothetical protein
MISKPDIIKKMVIRPTVRKRTVTLSVSLALVSVIAGCGGGSTSTGTSTKAAVAPTKAQFVKTANAICVKAENERGKALKTSPLEPLKKKLSTAQLNEVILESALPPIRGMAVDLSRLTPPQGDDQKVAEIVESLEVAIHRSETKPQDAVSGAAFVEADSKIKAYGLSSCSI